MPTYLPSFKKYNSNVYLLNPYLDKIMYCLWPLKKKKGLPCMLKYLNRFQSKMSQTNVVQRPMCESLEDHV